MEFKTGPKNVRIRIKVFDMLEQKKKSKQLRTKLFTSMKKADFLLNEDTLFIPQFFFFTLLLIFVRSFQ